MNIAVIHWLSELIKGIFVYLLLGERKQLILWVLLTYLYNTVQYWIGKYKVISVTQPKFFTAFKPFNSDSVLCSRVFWFGTILCIPFAKEEGLRWGTFSKLARMRKGARASRILILKGGIVQVGWNFPTLLGGGPKNNLSFCLQHLQAYWPKTSAD